ncbi:hypothetical protein BC940DRAFT_370641 [Gongronella butleri]|nr:hypothetical protein BC940DRAFT_370641 [Gongronella butleri]
MANHDDKLAHLLDLGFELEDCVRGLERHDDNLQQAANWLLTKDDSTTLRLDATLVGGGSAPIAAAPERVSEQDNSGGGDAHDVTRQRQEAMEQAKLSREQKRRDEQARRRALEEFKQDRQHVNALKPTMQPQPQPQPPHSHHDDVQSIQQKLVQDKQLDRMARKRALDRIQMDRIERKQNQPARRTPPCPSIAPTATPAPASSSAPTSMHALIQFKLIDGSTIREKFPCTATVHDVCAFVFAKEQAKNASLASMDQIILVSAYPRRTFTAEQGAMTVVEAGFHPNVSLNVARAAPVAPVVAATTNESTADGSISSNHRDDGDDGDDEEEDEEEDDEDDEEEEEEEEMSYTPEEPRSPLDASQAMAPTLPHSVINPHRARQRQRQHRSQPTFWRHQPTGSGQRLGDEAMVESVPDDDAAEQQQAEPMDVDQDEPDPNVPDRQNVLAAIQHRAAAAAEHNLSMMPPSPPRKIAKRRVCRTLKDTCLQQMSMILSSTSKDTNRFLKSMSSISPSLATVLSKHLMQTNKLDRLAMRRLARSCLEHMVLDTYSYTTDSLLAELAHSSTLCNISLRGCDLITDAGVWELQGLKHLEYLDLYHCKITDKGLLYLTHLPVLRHLNLGHTHITNKGFHQWTKHAACKDELDTLILTNCVRLTSSTTLAALEGFTELRRLVVDNTKLGPQEVKPTWSARRTLESLNISGTDMTDDDLIQWVAGLSKLRELSVLGCLKMTTRGLAGLARGLPMLSMIRFPHYSYEMDDLLPRFQDLPLHTLDLTSYAQVTDMSMDAISRMTRLTYLSLSGTKITDQGLATLSELHELQELFLDRTHITDQGIVAIKDLKHLITLSIAATLVTDDGLQVLGDETLTGFVHVLQTLNVQNCTGITDRGVHCLTALTHLTRLNLNHTSVTQDCLQVLTDLPHLQPVRLLGIERPESEEVV